MHNSNKLLSSKKQPATASIKRKNVQVVVRTRPLSEIEMQQRSKNVVYCDSVAKMVQVKSPTDSKYSERNFGSFDKVYGPETTQLQLYNDVVGSQIKEVLSGYNCTVFAYGQTGSGKTYTMEGRHADDDLEHTWQSDPAAGIIPRALHHLFTELGDGADATVRVSFVELYNEQIYDLLSASDASQAESLRIYDDKSKGVTIVGAEEIIVRNRDDVYALLLRGAEKRRTAATMMNITSSRSHSVFTINVMVREAGLVGSEELLRQGKFNLVDLAGSENIGRSGATDKRAREAGNINTSLLALGRVISALTTNASHIPYRESKLTRILQDSLGGKTITTIIATLSPASSNFEEILNTLDYAQRAKNIKNCPEVNQMISRKGLLKEYNDEIERLRRDLVATREKAGVYLDKENYNNMLEETDTFRAKVEELEGQLEAQLQHARRLFENLEYMDKKYETMFDKLQQAIEKLERRKCQVTELKLELAMTNDNFKSASDALVLSENSFVRLRAQALNLDKKCHSYFDELGKLHNQLDSHKQTEIDNNLLRNQFVRKNETAIELVKNSLNAYDEEAHKLFDHVLSTTHDSATKIDDFIKHSNNAVQKQMANSTEEVKKLMADSTDVIRKLVDDSKKLMDNAKKLMDDSTKALENLAENSNAVLAKLMDNSAEFLTKLTDNSNEVTANLVANSSGTVKKLSVNSKQLVGDVNTELDGLQKSTTELELNRVLTTGTTPKRHLNESFLEDLQDLPPSSVLLAQQKSILTPRRKSLFVERDSILDSTAFYADLSSPGAIKAAIKKEPDQHNLEKDDTNKNGH